MKIRFFAVLLLCLTSMLATAQPISYNGVKPVVIIDVRTAEEFAAGHIEGALNIPYEQIAGGIRSVKGLSKDQPVLVYCRSGRRSGIAKAALEKEGWKRILDGGGMDTLVKNLQGCTSRTC